MKKSHLIWSGVVVAMLMSASAVFAANPANVSRTSTGSSFLQATSGIRFVNGNLEGTQATPTSAVSKLNIGFPWAGRNTDRYYGSAKVRCNGNASTFVKTIGGPDYFAQISCPGIGNLWAATITIY
jgi:hypothetical protein